MSGLEHDLWCAARFKGFLPTRGAQAPLISGLQSGEVKLPARRAQVVSPCFGKFEKFRRDACADDMHSGIIRAAAAATIPVPTGQRVCRTRLKNGSEDVSDFDGHDRRIRRCELPSSGLRCGDGSGSLPGVGSTLEK
jgi:hypothetical protein